MDFLEEYKKDKLWREDVDGIHIRSDLLVSKRVLKLLGNINAKKILDLGCANGKVSRWLAKRGARVVGVDLTGNLIEMAKEIEKERRQGIEYFLGSALDEKLNLPYKKFDIVLALMLHLYFNEKEFKKSLKTIHGRLAENGKFIYANIHPCRILLSEQMKGAKLVGKREKLNYFKTQRWQTKLLSKSHTTTTTTYYNHPLNFVVNSLVDAGFKIAKIYEPQSTEAEMKKYPELLSKTDKLPSYLIIESYK
ncbi:MAG: class I SAM-dependent methyltransferase [bacterium]|nr:class I SAM-dependent methyltransferase [bacterium]